MPVTSEPAEPRRGLQGDLQRAKAGTFASAAELREFVQGLKGRSPQEVLGAVANSGLVQGVTLATVGTALLMAVFTVGPYVIYGGSKPPPTKAVATVEPAANTPAPEATTEKAAAPSRDPAANAQKTLDKMGESETKIADPKVNPLDDLDDLLDTKK